jgi:hypothetical protein
VAFSSFHDSGLAILFGAGHHRDGVEDLVLSLVTMFLARERVILIGGALGFCAAQSH